MASNHTPNYNLSQWERSDKVIMEDFNADNAKIDAALGSLGSALEGKVSVSALNSLSQTVSGLKSSLNSKGNGQIQVYSYTGNGACGANSPTVFTFPKRPAAVIITYQESQLFLFAGQTVAWHKTRSANYGLFVSWSGNTVSFYSGSAVDQMNVDGRVYQTVALLY